MGTPKGIGINEMFAAEFLKHNHSFCMMAKKASIGQKVQLRQPWFTHMTVGVVQMGGLNFLINRQWAVRGGWAWVGDYILSY